MRQNKVLVTSKTFGKFLDIGRDILKKEGLEILEFPEENRPATQEKLNRFLTHEEGIIAIASGSEPIGPVSLQGVKNLKIISKHGVGIDNIDIKSATEKGIAVTNASGTNIQAVADFTIGLMLSLARKICPANQNVKQGKWKKLIGKEVWNKTVGIIGTGSIGKEVIKRLEGFNVDILAHNRTEYENFAMKHDVTYLPLEKLLEKSDYVSLHLPLTNETRNLIGENEFRKMKTTSYFINTSRGEIVDYEALYHALVKEEIAGAALDVYPKEPWEENNLLNLKNVLTTPHMGASSYEAMELMDRICSENIVKILNEEKPDNLINPEVLEDLNNP